MNKIIEFEDQGQDFTTWEIDENGLIVDCKPFQASVWCGGIVPNHARLRAGSRVWWAKGDLFLCMNYKCTSFKKAANEHAGTK